VDVRPLDTQCGREEHLVHQAIMADREKAEKVLDRCVYL
jgi:hypothetical protein